ncbi:MAG TPA: BadM/Rrf2 family transcriptional regulator [Betaproteobacteria bacterium]|nr:BadM/Rrf2 family transcriptional regulator [Betaproteobacteria bacterium]
MQLTRHTDFALRTLIFLSLKEGGALATIGEIAECFAIPRNHLVKVVHRLGRLGYIQTFRGKGGGVRLGRVPGAVRLGAVVRAMEATLDIVDCQQSVCPLATECRLKMMLNEARNAFIAALDQYTLADLQQQPAALRAVLRMDAVLSR